MRAGRILIGVLMAIILVVGLALTFVIAVPGYFLWLVFRPQRPRAYLFVDRAGMLRGLSLEPKFKKDMRQK